MHVIEEHSFEGSVPTRTFEQVPTLPDKSHVWHVPEQAELQQTPSVQKPELQLLPIEQDNPLVNFGVEQVPQSPGQVEQLSLL